MDASVAVISMNFQLNMEKQVVDDVDLIINDWCTSKIIYSTRAVANMQSLCNLSIFDK